MLEIGIFDLFGHPADNPQRGARATYLLALLPPASAAARAGKPRLSAPLSAQRLVRQPAPPMAAAGFPRVYSSVLLIPRDLRHERRRFPAAEEPLSQVYLKVVARDGIAGLKRVNTP